MKSAFTIFVAFASVAQNSFVLSLNKSTSEILADIARIESDHDAAQGNLTESVIDSFDGFIRLAARNYFSKDNDIKNLIISNRTVQEFRNAHNIPYDALNLVAEQPDDVVQKSVDIASAAVGTSLSALNNALELANAGNYSQNQTHVAELETALFQAFMYPAQVMYAFLRSSIKHNEEVEAVINNLDNKTMALLNLAAGAYMNAMRLYDDAVAGGTHNVGVALLDEMEYQKSRAVALLEDRGHYLFSAITAIYTHLHLSSAGSVSGMYQRRYAMYISLRDCDEAFGAVYDVLSHKLNDFHIRIRSVGETDFFPRVTAQATFVNRLQAIIDICAETAPANNRSLVETHSEELTHSLSEFDNIVFKAINLIGAQNKNYSVIQDELNVLEMMLPYRELTNSMFDMIRNSNPNIQSESLSRINYVENKALGQVKNTCDNLFDAIRNVAKVYHGMEAEPLSNFRSNSIASGRAFMRSVFAAMEISSVQAEG